MRNNFQDQQCDNLPVHTNYHSSIPLNQNDITCFEQHIEQIPSRNNDFIAICTTSIGTQDKYYSNFGIGTPDMINGSTDTQQLLEIASSNATQKVASMLGKCSPEPSSIIDIDSIPTSGKPTLSLPQAHESQQVKYKHNPNKPMTSNQLQALERIANEKRISLSDAALQTTGKPIDNLSSYDANNLFDYYKKMNATA